MEVQAKHEPQAAALSQKCDQREGKADLRQLYVGMSVRDQPGHRQPLLPRHRRRCEEKLVACAQPRSGARAQLMTCRHRECMPLKRARTVPRHEYWA